MSTKTQLAKLTPVDLRTVWPDEARNFTPWLASEEGLRLLGEVLGASLVLVRTEVAVGPFSADMVLKVEGDEDHTVVVENQFGKTDHDHLGKLLTYAAGLGARTLVWVAQTFTDEHRQTLDWLNESAGEDLGYFGLEIRAFTINGSLPAPQFNVVSSPNWGTKIIRGNTTEESDLNLSYKAFWDEVREYFIAKGSPLRVPNGQPQSWTMISIGRAGFQIAIAVNNRRGKGLACEIYISHPNAVGAFEQLEASKAEIEREFGGTLSWERIQKNCRIAAYKQADFSDASQREMMKEWFRITAEQMNQVFAKRIKELKV